MAKSMEKGRKGVRWEERELREEERMQEENIELFLLEKGADSRWEGSKCCSLPRRHVPFGIL